MAIVKMNKFTAIGLDTAADDLMAGLMELGITELRSQDSKLIHEEWASFALKEKRDLEILELESKLSALDGVLKTLNAYDLAKKPLFSSRRAITRSAFSKTIAEYKKTIEDDVDIIVDLTNRLKELKNARNKIETAIIGLEPWAEYEIPLEVQETKYTYVLMGIVPPRVDIGSMKSAIEEITDQFVLSLIAVDQEQQYVSLIYTKEIEENINDVLKQHSFSQVLFKELTGSVTKNIARYKSKIDDITEKIIEIEKGFYDMAERKEEIELLYDYLAITRDETKGFNNMLGTESAFYIDGWVPAAESENLSTFLTSHGCHVEIIAPDKDEETPVLLKNNKFIAPVEIVTNLYALPSSREIDPTPIIAPFYICFFGIMFADMGYGAILSIASFVLVRSGKLEGNTYKFIKQLGYCGVSIFIWGAIFGSFFGNLVTVFSETFLGKTVTIAPLWFDPVENAMTMLAFSCLFGVFHLFVALAVKAYLLIRDGRIWEAFNDVFLWYVLFIGIGLLLAGDMLFASASDIGKYLTVIGAGGIVALPLFYARGAAKALGLWKLYGIVNYLADVLSYARLLALCLAGTIIAQVFNMLAGMAANGVIGAILFVLIVVVAHVFNFLISGLGAFVHAIRLQYVEFFGKFYEGGGIPFQPFMRNTKYVKIVKEGN